MGPLIIILLLFLVMWLLLIRPQRRAQAQQAAMHARLAVGDEIVTAGGLYGTIQGLDEDDVRVEIAPGITVRVARRAVAAVLDDDDADDPDEADAEEQAGLETAGVEELPPASETDPISPERR